MTPQPPWWMLPSLAAFVLLIFACALAASCFIGNDTLQTTMFTATVTITTGVAAYYFGSSSSSQKKDDTLAQVISPQSPAPVVTTTRTDAHAGTAETTTEPARP